MDRNVDGENNDMASVLIEAGLGLSAKVNRRRRLRPQSQWITVTDDQCLGSVEIEVNCTNSVAEKLVL